MTDFSKMTIDEKRDYITEKLLEGEVTVEFTKVDGSLRTMPCTLSTDLLPANTSIVETKERKENKEVMRVYCSDKKEWRSFRIANVISIT